ncbi:MAG TPA: SUMF1/EgtB/PvdO family nonheme iron enzyme, partial [Thermoanaerobaculia bacterium]
WYERPIPLRNPIVFYEGHLPVFAVNTLLKAALGEKGIDEHFERLFARGIDPEDENKVDKSAQWPTRDEVKAYAAEAEARLRNAILHAELEIAGHPFLDGAAALHTIVEHELMHQETLMYIFHRLPFELKSRPRYIDQDGWSVGSGESGWGDASRSTKQQSLLPEGAVPDTPLQRVEIDIPAGDVTLGQSPELFGWDNEFPRSRVRVPSFRLDAHSVTNGDFLEFVVAGGYSDPRWWPPGQVPGKNHHPFFWERQDGSWFWRGMFEHLPLPESWPVYATWQEANAFAHWKGGRLMTEPEYHRAAFGGISDVERMHPWGEAVPAAAHGNFDLRRLDPLPVGTHPHGASAWGIHDLVGNGWEWTSSLFAPFDGFTPMPSYPQYSADFFDGAHFVMKGASPATPAGLVRRSFRNWFRPNYPYVYAKFRVAY